MEPKELNQMTEEDKLRYYKDAYEREKCKRETLTNKLSHAGQERAEAESRLNRIKGSVVWRLSKPLRSLVHWLHRTRERLGYYGSIKGIARKLNAKSIERKARARHGTASFPDAEEENRQLGEKFSRDIKFSILVPLYNTPEKFLRQAIDSVRAQTYPNWELCLADGSDAEHADVERICKEYAQKDPRVRYRKLPGNEGIAGNTNACLAMASGDYIALFDHDDVLHPSVLYEYMKVICD